MKIVVLALANTIANTCNDVWGIQLNSYNSSLWLVVASIWYVLMCMALLILQRIGRAENIIVVNNYTYKMGGGGGGGIAIR